MIVLRSRAAQTVAVVMAFAGVALANLHTDGLWFQGDAPRHAANGLFWWDLLTASPNDPLGYAVSYYARYPVIAPVTYPPVFYVLEGIGFALFGPSPYVGRVIVQLFAIVAGLYTAAWARRWIAPEAGWSGAFLAFLPGMVLWSNAVMLNVPATALSLGALYHFRRAREADDSKHLAAAAVLVAGAILTYYPAAPVVCVCAAWMLYRWRDRWSTVNARWIAIAVFAAGFPLVISLLQAPVHTTRHLPSIGFLLSPGTWVFYWTRLPVVLGLAFWGGLAGCAAGLASARLRHETVYLVLWIITVIFCLSLVPARDGRYALIAAPAFVLASAIGLAVLLEHARVWRVEWSAAALAIGLGSAFYSSTATPVPYVSGFREVAAYLATHGARDAVLYEGAHDGLFGFYARALDPGFERRMVLARKLLYEYGPTSSFEWVETSNVQSAGDVVTLLRTRCGCRYVALEVAPAVSKAAGRRLLAEAVAGPEFELVQRFPIEGAGLRRVDLYRLLSDVDRVESIDLTFPSLSTQQFLHVQPVSR